MLTRPRSASWPETPIPAQMTRPQSSSVRQTDLMGQRLPAAATGA
jgi:hypothetical protein